MERYFQRESINISLLLQIQTAKPLVGMCAPTIYGHNLKIIVLAISLAFTSPLKGNKEPSRMPQFQNAFLFFPQ